MYIVSSIECDLLFVFCLARSWKPLVMQRPFITTTPVDLGSSFTCSLTPRDEWMEAKFKTVSSYIYWHMMSTMYLQHIFCWSMPGFFTLDILHFKKDKNKISLMYISRNGSKCSWMMCFIATFLYGFVQLCDIC